MPPHIQIVVQPDDTLPNCSKQDFFFGISARSHHSGATNVNAKPEASNTFD